MKNVSPVSMSYQEIRPLLQTGDIVLFSGVRLFSRLIKIVTRSMWSHIAMIVRDDKDNVLCWESSGGKGVVEHSFADEYKFSEQIRRSTAAGEVVAIRQLFLERSKGMLDAYFSFRDEAKGRPYERDKIEFLNAILGVELVAEDLSSLFCSELIAETYKRMGLLDPSISSNKYAPKDFSNDGTILLLNGYLHDEVIVHG